MSKKKKTETHYYMAELRGCFAQKNAERYAELLLDGEHLEFRKEPKNKHDKNAVAVYWLPPMQIADRLRVPYRSRHKLGYVAREVAAELSGSRIISMAYTRRGDTTHMLKIGVEVEA